MMTVMMRTEKSKAALIDFCRYINGLAPTQQMTLIEIGSFAGDSTEIFCKWFKHVVAIDPWVSGIGDITDKVDMEEVYQVFQKKIAAFPNVRIIRDYSYNALKFFDNKLCDIVYIDGGHTYPEVYKDVFDWSHKIKIGGFIAGHDYWKKFPGVVKAVNELVGKPDKIFPDSSWIKRV